jgi:hypothetical protein
MNTASRVGACMWPQGSPTLTANSAAACGVRSLLQRNMQMHCPNRWWHLPEVRGHQYCVAFSVTGKRTTSAQQVRTTSALAC